MSSPVPSPKDKVFIRGKDGLVLTSNDILRNCCTTSVHASKHLVLISLTDHVINGYLLFEQYPKIALKLRLCPKEVRNLELKVEPIPLLLH